MSEKKRKKIEIKSEGRRKSTSPRVGCPFAGTGEEAEPGSWLVGLGQGSAAARPLDGGVLTRWGARAPVRGPATAPWPLHRRCSRRLALGQLMVVLSLRRDEVERGESGEEERGSSRKNELGFRSRARGVGFYTSEMRARPSDVNGWPRLNGPSRDPGRRAGARDFAGLGPGCGLGASCAREKKWAEPFLWFLGRNSKV